MKYFSGQDVKLGDRVRLDNDGGGVVVGIIQSGEYLDGFSADTLGYLKFGALIRFPMFGVIHYETPDEDVELLGRAE